MKSRHSFVAFMTCIAIGCGGTAHPSSQAKVQREIPQTEVQSAPQVSVSPASTQLTEPKESPREPSSPTVRLLERKPITGPSPRIQVLLPKDGDVVRGNLKLKLRVDNWPLEAAPGNHVHVRVDDREEITIHDVSSPIDLAARYEKKFGEALSEGTHVLRVFLARANHESVKLPSAFALTLFHYKKKSTDFRFDRTKPFLTYSRPQGCASDSTRLLDFFISNLNTLSPKGYRVEYEIDGVHRGSLSAWSPHAIENLQDETTRIRLRLVDPNGDVVPGPFNDTTREIKGTQSCPELGLVPDEDADEDDEHPSHD